MPSLAEVLRRHWLAYEKKFGARLLPSHRSAVRAILSCRTPALGGQLFGCECGQRQFVYHSCNHRACPRCGHAEATRWLERQRRRLLPLPYYLVTFTVPEQLRPFFYSHQRILYSLFLQHSARALLEVGRDHKDLGGQLGLLAVLQTWTRDLRYHPHVHCVVPGGGLADNGLRWVRPRYPDHFLPDHVLARRLRTRFQNTLQKEHPQLFHSIPAKVWARDWVANIQPVGSGQPALKYLSAYVYRTAFSSEKILSNDERGVTFAYRDHSGQRQTASLTPNAFLERFLQHVLPRGFQRVRYFGWLSPAASTRFQRIAALLDWRAPALTPPSPRPAPQCPCCHQPMFLMGRLPRSPPPDTS